MFWIQVSMPTSLKKDLSESVSFFVLSGFIIAYNYQEKLLTKTTTKRTFWVARIARIYPLHLLTLLIAACIGGYVQYIMRHFHCLPESLMPYSLCFSDFTFYIQSHNQQLKGKDFGYRFYGE